MSNHKNVGKKSCTSQISLIKRAAWLIVSNHKIIPESSYMVREKRGVPEIGSMGRVCNLWCKSWVGNVEGGYVNVGVINGRRVLVCQPIVQPCGKNHNQGHALKNSPYHKYKSCINIINV